MHNVDCVRLTRLHCYNKMVVLIEWNYIQVAVITAVILFNVVLNVLVIVVIAKYPELREDRTTLMMFSLSVSDLAAGCTTMPISAVLCAGRIPTTHLKQVQQVQVFCRWLFGFNSLHSLCWITVCKMITVLKPLRHEKLLTRSHCYGIIIFNWVVGAAIAANMSRMGVVSSPDICIYFLRATSSVSGLNLLVYAVTVVIPGVVLVYATARIFVVVAHTHAAINRQVHALNPVGLNTASAGLVTLHAIRSARNVLVICIVSVLLTLPMSAMLLIHRRHPLPAELIFATVWLFFSNTFLNSLLYITLYRSIRKKTKQLLTDVYTFLRRD